VITDRRPDARPAAASSLPEDELVARIVRVSRSRVLGSAMDEMFAARKRLNASGGVPGLRGAVLHVSGWFVLWQEGPWPAIEAVLKPSRSTQRHGVPRLIHRSVGPRTLREPLALTATQWPEGPDQFAARIEAVASQAADHLPQEVWRALSEPCSLGTASDPPRPDARTALVVSDDQRSTEAVRRMAEALRRPLVYRRFAGADPGTADVGAAYFDLSVQGRPRRVQAVSRRAFAHGLVHDSLRMPDRLALLVGQQAQKAMELAAGAASFLQRAEVMPAVEVAGPAGAALEVAELLRQRGVPSVRLLDAGITDSQLAALLLGLPPG
jgi:hypothetical protein